MPKLMIFGCALWALLGVTTVAGAQEPEIVVEVDRDKVYVGESIIYQLTLNHVENPSAPDLSSFKNFTVEFLGEQSLNSQQITIINGRRSEVIRRGMMYQYRLTPTDSSTTEIPAPTADVNGQTLTGRSVPISVIAPSDQNIALLQMSCDQTSVFLMRPFTVTLKVLIKRLPDEISDRSPLSVQDRSPVRLVIPWLDDQNLPTGLDPQVEWREILQPMMQTSRRGFREDPDGFQINNIGTTSISFFGRETTVFKPTPKPVDQTDDEGNVVQYFEYTFERTFTASKPGSYSLGPVNLKGTFGTEIKNGRLAGEEVYAVSDTLKIEAKSAPLANRPGSYIGVIGQNFVANASLAPSEGRVGDPMTLMVRISGSGHIDDAVPPSIGDIEGMNAKFRTYDATIDSQQNAKVFTYSLRPLTTEVTEFPAIPVSYFDPIKEDYVTIQTAAIPVSIQEARELSGADIVSSAGATKPADPLLQATSGGIFANHSSLESLKATSFSLKHWAGIWATMLSTFAIVSLGMKRQQRLHADPAFVRRKAARLNAANTLKSLQPGSDDKALLDTINDAIKGLIADFTGNASAGMTSSDAVNHLAAAGINHELQQRTRQFMDQCDAARYGASLNSPSELITICKTLVTDLGAALEKQC
ncbi:MAG: BatD family protein [Fuerstiella sp.]